MRVLALLLLVLPLALLLAGCVSLRPFSEIRKEVPEDRFIRVGDQLVHIERLGQGEPVVLLHGFGASTYAWRKVLPGLAKEFEVIAIDLNGFGYTQRPKDRESYTREGQTRLVLGVMDALGIGKAHFVGHSYGGAITLWTASRHPERVRSMVLVDSAAPTYPEDRRSSLAAFRSLSLLFVRGVALRPGAVRRALERSVYDDSIVTPELVQGYFDRLRIEGLGDAYHGLTAPSRSRPETVDLRTIDVPALLVWGAEDELVPVHLGRGASGLLPRSTFEVLEKTGHLPMEERPEELLGLMLPFLERQRG
ncbi:MAG TPA: alpha/beta fold hydrolase [Thermoanaerobaculia bacterium]|nr:alpha/beta fold hydrolase [Thermoanaerobaculia bacterium]